MPDKKYLRTYDRADFLTLMTQVAYAIAPQHFLDKANPLVIAIYGPARSGKSLAAEALLKGWMDDFSHADIMAIPPDDKMFWEEKPMAATQTISKLATVQGEPITLSFNSKVLLFKDQMDDAVASVFNHHSAPGVLIISNAEREHYYDEPASPVFLEIDMANPLIGKDPFHRDITLTLFHEGLLDDPSFNAYWQRMEDLFKYDRDRERALLRPKMEAPPPLPGRLLVK